ncbi:MAG: D-glycero-beta-D-manno-heptose 1-phosphate adenylyltransferase [Bacteroidales bacterium]|jgi:rfaE bifunctional protein nucleotidyltransferase chain/domain|nr:D-glycero-beta-D-manno-heptose 1-phosphate adenylyltransferase [Bacteroidales bacterium]
MDNLTLVKSKIVSLETIKEILKSKNRKSKKIVFTNGCFDIIHRGHIEYLAQAANYGDILIIGVNTDKSVKKIKGENRPVQDEYARAMILAALHFVNYIVLFDDDTPYNLIKEINPNILIKGSDYKKQDIVGYDIVTKNNGDVITIDFLEGYSTTSIIKKLTKK